MNYPPGRGVVIYARGGGSADRALYFHRFPQNYTCRYILLLPMSRTRVHRETQLRCDLGATSQRPVAEGFAGCKRTTTRACKPVRGTARVHPWLLARPRVVRPRPVHDPRRARVLGVRFSTMSIVHTGNNERARLLLSFENAVATSNECYYNDLRTVCPKSFRSVVSESIRSNGVYRRQKYLTKRHPR